MWVLVLFESISIPVSPINKLSDTVLKRGVLSTGVGPDPGLCHEPQQEAHCCQHGATRQPRGAAERGQGGEHSITCIPGQWQVADGAFAAGCADLVLLVLYVCASSRQAVLQGHAALGDGHALSSNSHHVLAEAVPRASRTVDIRSPAVAFIIICCPFAGETFKSMRKWRGWKEQTVFR